MPFITKEEIAKRRKAIKAALPGFKVSVRTMDHCGIAVTIQEGPISMPVDSRGYEQVNPYYYKEHYKQNPEVVRVLDQVMAIAASDQEESFYDGDYGSVPNFYVQLSIGNWDRPYQVTNK